MLYTFIATISAKVNIFLDELMDQIDSVASDFGDNSDDEYDEESNTYIQKLASVSKHD
jgi:ribosome assembly protein YihI (activator of Der GTPase)